MTKLLSSLAAPAFAVALAGGLFLQMRTYARVDDPSAFHARIREAVEDIPIRMGPWEGTDTQPPPAAGMLLRPNKILCRNYRDEEGRRWAKLIFIHCKDARDMSGHYPPNCYPGNGWTMQGPPTIGQHQLWGRSVPIAEYHFSRAELNRTISTVVYDFFVLPTGKFCTRMEDVRGVSGDYRSRPLGCAQVQVVMDAATRDEERPQILREMLEPLGPTIDVLQSTTKGDSQ
jgi:hypothetical protein